MTVRGLAGRVGLSPSSASYLSQLESGTKTPHPHLARRLAAALGDDPRIYLAWSATGKRSSPLQTARAVRALADLLHHPAYDLSPSPPGDPQEAAHEFDGALAPLVGPPSSGSAGPGVPALDPAPPEGVVPSARLLVPELEEGADPGDGARAPRALAMHRIVPASLGAVEPLLRPFAYRLSADGARRVSDVLTQGDVAVLTRRVWPPETGAPCAVRLAGHLVLARVLWNGRQLLLLPGPGQRDFIVLDAPDRTTLERLLAGRVVAVLRPADGGAAA